jgi:hypothetical protein
MSGALLGDELTWIGTGTTLGALAAQRRHALEWLVVGFVFGPLTLIALVRQVVG